MPRPFPVEVRRRAVALLRAGKPVTTTAAQLGVSAATIHNWFRQDQIHRGERPGITTPESIELAKAKERIRQLETEVEILKAAAKLLGEDSPGLKGSTPGSMPSPRPVTGSRSVAGCWASVARATTSTSIGHSRALGCADNG